MGRYRILEELGQGLTAHVYRAFDEVAGCEVALKVMSREVSDCGTLKRFFRQARMVKRLDGVKNVARVRDRGRFPDGELEGRPYLALDLFPGTLHDCLSQYWGRAPAIAALVRTLARTVGQAHARKVAHLDLKPSNVLMSSRNGFGTPHLTDFGAARLIEPSPRGGRTRIRELTPLYTAPEVFLPKPYVRETADIYSLGAILYELLVGERPHDGRTIAVHEHLELICLCCLEKNPRLRYESAADLAKDLGRFIHHEPPLIARLGVFARVWRRCRRHPRTAWLTSAALLLTLAAIVFGFRTARALEADLLEQTTHANEYAAEMAAGKILSLHRGFGDALRPCAKHPAIVQHLTFVGGRGGEAVTKALRDCPPRLTFDSVLLLDLAGRPLARAPAPPQSDYFLKDFEFRDYIAGARRLAARRLAWQVIPPETRGPEPEDFYVARAHESEGDGQFKFSIGMPIFDAPAGEPSARCAGYLMATLGTDETLGRFPLAARDDRIGVLASLRDREREEVPGPMPRDFRVLIHKGLAHGQTVPVDDPELETLERRIRAEDPEARRQFEESSSTRATSSTHHVDKVAGFEGEWLASMARVGQTDQVVIIQSRYRAIELVKDYLWQVIWAAGLLLAVAYVVLFVVPAVRRRTTG